MAPQAHRPTMLEPSGRCFSAVFQGLAVTRELQPNGLHPFHVGGFGQAVVEARRQETLPILADGEPRQRHDGQAGISGPLVLADEGDRLVSAGLEQVDGHRPAHVVVIDQEDSEWLTSGYHRPP